MKFKFQLTMDKLERFETFPRHSELQISSRIEEIRYSEKSKGRDKKPGINNNKITKEDSDGASA